MGNGNDRPTSFSRKCDSGLLYGSGSRGGQYCRCCCYRAMPRKNCRSGLWPYEPDSSGRHRPERHAWRRNGYRKRSGAGKGRKRSCPRCFCFFPHRRCSMRNAAYVPSVCLFGSDCRCHGSGRNAGCSGDRLSERIQLWYPCVFPSVHSRFYHAAGRG